MNYLKVPPHNIEAEKSVLGAILLDKEVILDVANIIKPSDFYKEIHKEIYESLLDLYNKNIEIDLISLSEKLKTKKTLDSIGGITYLTELMDYVPTTLNAKSYAKIVKEKSVRRQVIKSAIDIQNKAYEAEYENEIDIKSDALEILSSVEVNDSKKNKSLKNVIQEIKEDLSRKRNQDSNTDEKYYTGLTDYDYWLDGLHEQEFTIIGARPSLGKTALGFQIALHFAKRGLHTSFMTLEMSDKQIISRLLSSELNINSHKLRKPKLMTDDEYNKIMQNNYVENLPLYIDEIKYIQDLRAYCRNMKQKNKLDVLFIDYLQLMMTMKKTGTRNEEIGDISRNLKMISKEFRIPVVALAQLSRALEKENREPRLSDLRECGDIEQDADVVLFLHKPSDADDLAEIQERKIIIAKQRNGATGYFNLLFEGKTFKFKSIAKELVYTSRNTRNEEL